eukprot:gene11653-biopygen18417
MLGRPFPNMTCDAAGFFEDFAISGTLVCAWACAGDGPSRPNASVRGTLATSPGNPRTIQTYTHNTYARFGHTEGVPQFHGAGCISCSCTSCSSGEVRWRSARRMQNRRNVGGMQEECRRNAGMQMFCARDRGGGLSQSRPFWTPGCLSVRLRLRLIFLAAPVSPTQTGADFSGSKSDSTPPQADSAPRLSPS